MARTIRLFLSGVHGAFSVARAGIEALDAHLAPAPMTYVTDRGEPVLTHNDLAFGLRMGFGAMPLTDEQMDHIVEVVVQDGIVSYERLKAMDLSHAQIAYVCYVAGTKGAPFLAPKTA